MVCCPAIPIPGGLSLVGNLEGMPCGRYEQPDSISHELYPVDFALIEPVPDGEAHPA